MKPYWPILVWAAISLAMFAWLLDYFRLPTVLELWHRSTGLYLDVKDGQDITEVVEAAVRKAENFPWWRARIIFLPSGRFIQSAPLALGTVSLSGGVGTVVVYTAQP